MYSWRVGVIDEETQVTGPLGAATHAPLQGAVSTPTPPALPGFATHPLPGSPCLPRCLEQFN